MSKAVNTKIWFISISTIFLTRGFIFATWISRGPEVKDLLRLNNAQMGFYTALTAIGGLILIMYSGLITARFGSRRVSVISFSIIGISFLILGISIETHQVIFASIFLFFDLGSSTFSNALPMLAISLLTIIPMMSTLVLSSIFEIKSRVSARTTSSAVS